MGTKELTNYIKNYLEHDITNRAIMLSAPWGTGKTFYIQNSLIQELTHKKSVYISLYGIQSIKELNKSLYLEIMFNKLKQKKHKKSTKIKKFTNKIKAVTPIALNISNTILKNACNIDINIDWDKINFDKLLKSVDFSGKLIILDDVERANIDLIELLGYINNLEEHDNLKVLLVANEQEILKYNHIEKDGKRIQVATEKTELYLKIKEKTISDTIPFQCDINQSIEEIVAQFYDKDTLNLFRQIIQYKETEESISTIEKILTVMDVVKKYNLRSVIYACQKTVDFLQNLNRAYDLLFLQNLFLGNVAFCLQNKQNKNLSWQEFSLSSQKLGCYGYPMYKCCFDFFKYNAFKIEEINHIEQVFKIAQQQEKTNQYLIVLYSYRIQTEKNVLNAITHIKQELQTDNSIPFSEYLRIINYLISAKTALSNNEDIVLIKELMKNNIKKAIKNKKEVDLIFNSGIQLFDKENKEFDAIYKELQDEIKNNISCGLKENFSIEEFCDYFLKNEIKSKRNYKLISSFNMEHLINVLKNATAKQIEDVRQVFLNEYDYLDPSFSYLEDLNILKDLYEKIKELKKYDSFDRIQLLQLNLFIYNLTDIIKQLQNVT